MNILKVIHGYPPTYNAGSEIYSQSLCQALSQAGHRVQVFAREENPFEPDYTLRWTRDERDPRIAICLINLPLEKHRYRYHHPAVDTACATMVDQFCPDVVHIGHLNHLSVTLVEAIHSRSIPMVYTLHDFWLLCPRGQLLQRNSTAQEQPFALCDGQDDRKCATQCYSGYFSGFATAWAYERDYWQHWVKQRMAVVRSSCAKIDAFIAPSHHLRQRFIDDFALPAAKILYLDYGFQRDYLTGRHRISESSFVFGYIGTHIPAKGIDHLIKAFAELAHPQAKLRIWGRHRGQNTQALQRLAASLPQQQQQRIEWMPEYRNRDIVAEVFNQVDVIVVPSIWQENSPLVIHEALQAGVGVITAEAGGMAEYVQHRRNGWLFKHRDTKSLARVMRQVLENEPDFNTICQRGYLPEPHGHVIDMAQQATELVDLYQRLITQRKGS